MNCEASSKARPGPKPTAWESVSRMFKKKKKVMVERRVMLLFKMWQNIMLFFLIEKVTERLHF